MKLDKRKEEKSKLPEELKAKLKLKWDLRKKRLKKMKLWPRYYLNLMNREV